MAEMIGIAAVGFAFGLLIGAGFAYEVGLKAGFSWAYATVFGREP